MAPSCHFTCLTCNGSSFNSCLSCLAPRVFVNSVCECQPFSDAICSSNILLDYYQPFDFLQTFFTLFLVFVGLMYMLDVRLKFTYRIFSVLQMCSYAINMNIYFNGQTQYFLRILYRSNGGFFLPFRFSTFSVHNSVCTAIVFCLLVVIFLSQYWLTTSYMNRNIDTYQGYLLSNVYKFIQTVYFLQSKYFIMFFVQTIMSATNQGVMDGALGPAVVEIILVIFHMGYSIYIYKNQQPLNPKHYPRHFSLYVTFAPLTMLILPIAPNYGWIIYIIPAGLLILVLIIGREQQFNRWTILLYVSEAIFCCIPLGIVFVEDDNKPLYCLIICFILLIICIVECAITYFFASISEEPEADKQIHNKSIQSHESTQQNLNLNASIHQTSMLGIK